MFRWKGFVFFFWSAENGEPVHIHVAKGRPEPDSTKFWLTVEGGCLLVHNRSGLSAKELRDVERIVVANHADIVDEWARHFGVESVRFQG